MTQAYVYKWTHKPTLNWYVGSRTSKKANPNDGYICSSPKIKLMILQNPQDWERTIIDIGEQLDMYNLETEILQTVDAAKDQRSFNKHNNTGKCFMTGRTHSPETIEKMRQAALKRPKRPLTEEHKKKLSDIAKGVPKSESHRQSMMGRVVTEETRMKIRLAQKGIPKFKKETE